MKHLFKAAFALAVTTLFSVSCQKETPYTDSLTETVQSEEILPEVSLVFAESQQTKAFFGATAAAESFEKSISSLTVLVFDSSSKLQVRRSFTAAEIAGKAASFRVPKNMAETECSFYAVANQSVESVTTLNELLAALDNSPSDYNGKFDIVSSSAKRSGGFLMSGSTTATIAASGTTTEVSISLRRTVAKIAVQTSISSQFATTYGGLIKVVSASIENAPQSVPIIASDAASSAALTYTVTQSASTADQKWNSLFYVYDNSKIENHGSVKLKISALYDLDGDVTTTNDQRLSEYEISLTGSGNGVISRNGYYRIAATINGPSGDDCTANVTAEDWETPTTQEVTL